MRKSKINNLTSVRRSDIISWYPVIEVLKHTSPVAVPSYPIPIPLKIDLFSRTKIPGLKFEFFVEFTFRFLINYNS